MMPAVATIPPGIPTPSAILSEVLNPFWLAVTSLSFAACVVVVDVTVVVELAPTTNIRVLVSVVCAVLVVYDTAVDVVYRRVEYVEVSMKVM